MLLPQIIIEERCKFVLALYLIRKQYKRMGLFQPDFICVIFHQMMPGKLDRTNDEIRKATENFAKENDYEKNYGHISDWNTSRVTDMNNLFAKLDCTNLDISKWDVSKVRSIQILMGISLDGM
jgi:hypothetical protein